MSSGPRCRLGETAWVVRSSAGNEGRLVWIVADHGRVPIGGQVWEVISLGTPLVGVSGRLSPRAVVLDSVLSPMPRSLRAVALPSDTSPAKLDFRRYS